MRRVERRKEQGGGIRKRAWVGGRREESGGSEGKVGWTGRETDPKMTWVIECLLKWASIQCFESLPPLALPLAGPEEGNEAP